MKLAHRRAALAVIALLLAAGGALVLSHGGTSRSSASGAARSYVKAVFARDGQAFCAMYAPKITQIINEHVQTEMNGSTSSGGKRYDCGSFMRIELGYPHENETKQYLGGRLLGVGGERSVVRDGIRYTGVSVRSEIDFRWTGYAPGHSDSEQGTAKLSDIVWLQPAAGGGWEIAKPSLTLAAALWPPLLDDHRAVAAALAPPPDPAYAMTAAEQKTADAIAYRKSFRTISRKPIRCPGKPRVVADPRNDLMSQERTNDMKWLKVRGGNDIAQVSVVYGKSGACVSVRLTRAPTTPTSIDFNPVGADLPPVQVLLTGRTTYRAGSSTAESYAIKGLGVTKLNAAAVPEVAVAGTTVSFRVATWTATFGRPIGKAALTSLRWSLSVGTNNGAKKMPSLDTVPGSSNPAHEMAVDQKTGKIVKRY